jgi:hypothetical protein
METTFKISRKLVKYIQIEYVSNLPKKPWFCEDHIWFSTAKEGRKFVDMVRKLEVGIKKEIKENNYGFDFRLVIHKYLKVIDSISSGLDVRSKLSIDVLSEGFTSGYNNQRNEAIKYCDETFIHIKENYETIRYEHNWKDFDKVNVLIDEFLLDYEKISDKSFKTNTLDELNKMSGEILELLIKKRKEFKDGETN